MYDATAQIRKLLVDDQFTEKFSSSDLNVWKSFKQTVFLGKYRAETFVEKSTNSRPSGVQRGGGQTGRRPRASKVGGHQKSEITKTTFY